jgi:hypothetical protein
MAICSAPRKLLPSCNSLVTKGHALHLTMMFGIRGNQGSEGTPTDPICHEGQYSGSNSDIEKRMKTKSSGEAEKLTFLPCRDSFHDPYLPFKI